MSRRARYIVGCSFGKDSLATVITAVEHGEPLDEAVYCEVMFDEHISGEVPEHRDFIYEVGIPALKSMGIKTTIIRGKRTYVSSFTRVIEKGPHAGQINAFPLCGRCCIQRDCKIRPIEKWVRSLEGDVVQYIGLAADEQERLMKKGIQNHVSILQKYGITKADTYEICKRNGLLSPIYEFAPRGGCFFCPNAKRPELRHLYDHHPELWERMVELAKLPNKATEMFDRDFRFLDIDADFRLEDAQISISEYLDGREG